MAGGCLGWVRCISNRICDGDGGCKRNCVGGGKRLNLILTEHVCQY